MLTPLQKIQIRSKALKQTRAFFDDRGFLETDVPICNKAAAVDAYIDLFEVKEEGFLHSSPELRMKDYLCNGSGNIYFLGHVFRKEEIGSRHHSEFTMLEYYRIETTEEIFLKEVIDYLSLFLGKRKIETLSYDDAMEKYSPTKLSNDTINYTEEEKRHYIFSHHVEPALGKNCFTILTNFPACEASLAQTKMENGKLVAKRFEIFVDGVELGNGFLELSCEKTARTRFVDANTKRTLLYKPSYPLDEIFLKNLEKGLPKNTYGIAIGFDRLLMLANDIQKIHNIIL
ncbi:MAG: Elongation factor P--(R)-beta-lysine ligase [Chlamydiia bacterium]|nr:Elongation factor P--(R)-beta-lysine ligase [Chlamydiia bacterium]